MLALWNLLALCSLVVVPVLSLGPFAAAQVADVGPELDRIGIDEHLGQRLPLDMPFHDEQGQAVVLGDFFDGKRPVVLTLAYHTCPVICSQVLHGAVTAMGRLPWLMGKEYVAVNISIDPRDTAQGAQKLRKEKMAEYGREAAEPWHFLTGSEDAIAQVAKKVGLKYFYDERQAQYAHPAFLVLATGEGNISRYFYGLGFPPDQVRIALLEAAQGNVTSTLERVLMYCYRFDPQGGKYVIVAVRVMQIGGALIGLAVAAFLLGGWRWERRKRNLSTNPLTGITNGLGTRPSRAGRGKAPEDPLSENPTPGKPTAKDRENVEGEHASA